MTRYLTELDGRSIKQQERQYLTTLSQRKQSSAFSQQKKSIQNQNANQPTAGFGVDGQQKQVYGNTHA